MELSILSGDISLDRDTLNDRNYKEHNHYACTP